MTSAKLEYEKGNFGPILSQSDPADFELKLFATLFQCEPIYIFERLQKELDNLQNSKQKLRLLLLKCMQLHTFQKHEISSQQLKHIPNNSFLTGKMDDFYLSTHRYLLALDKIKLMEKYTPDIGLSIIGDSHLISISNAIEFELGFSTYLPGITLRGLCSPFENSYKSAVRNAMAMHQRKNNIVLSIGEIDQRVSYKHAIKGASQDYGAYLSSLLKSIDIAIDYLMSLKAPHQTLYAMALPRFDANLVEETHSGLENINLISDQVAMYSQTFHSKCESVGIRLLGKDYFQSEDAHKNLLDHAHFHPDSYKSIFRSEFG